MMCVRQEWRALLHGGNGEKRVSGGELGTKSQVEETKLCVQLTLMEILK